MNDRNWGGKRPGAGRPVAGTPPRAKPIRSKELAAERKLTEGLQELIEAGQFIEPIDFMLQVLNDPNEDRLVRLAAAKAAAPYRHPTLQAVQVQHLGPDGKPEGPRLVHVERRLDAVPALTMLPGPSDMKH